MRPILEVTMLNILARISIWRANPQDLPVSYAWLSLALVAHVVADVISLADAIPIDDALDAGILDTAALAAVTALLLALRGLNIRFPQTLTALAGASVIISLVAYASHKLMGGVLPLPLVSLVFLAWYLVTYTHVLRHALSVSPGAGLAASLLYLVASAVISGLYLVPPPET
jgi:hypothetical protein